MAARSRPTRVVPTIRPAPFLLLALTVFPARPIAVARPLPLKDSAQQTHQTGRASQRDPAEFDRLRREAEAARTAGRLDAALDLYTRAVRLRPSWIEGHWYLGTTAYEMNRFPECRDAFSAVVRAQAGNGAAWAFKGLCGFQLRAYDTALADLEKAERLGIGDDAQLIAVTTYHRAILATRLGQYERALRIYVEFARSGDVPPLVVDAAGLAMLRMPLLPGDVPPAKRDLVARAGRAALMASGRMTGPAQQELAELVRAYPDEPNVHYAYGLLLLGEDPDRALDEFKEELKRVPSHGPAMLQIAQELSKRGAFEEARPWALDAVRLAPRSFVAHRVLGQIQLATGDVPGAIRSLETAVALEPDSPSAHFNLARAYQRAGRTSDAARARATFTRLERLQRTRRGDVTTGTPAPERDGLPDEPLPR